MCVHYGVNKQIKELYSLCIFYTNIYFFVVITGMVSWSPTMFADMAEYLVKHGDRPLCRRLLTDYKENKAYSYFQSGWLQEVFYHPIYNIFICTFKKYNIILTT